MSEPSATLRERLLDAGLLVDAGLPGLYLRSAQFAGLVRAVGDFTSRRSPTAVTARYEFPPVLTRTTLERADYPNSFPDLIGAIFTFHGDAADHKRLLSLAEQGGDWTALLSASQVTLSSASCHPLYPVIAAHPVPESGLRYEVFGDCFRNEPSADPARMMSFHQVEYVYAGTAEGAEQHRDVWVAAAVSLLGELGLTVATEVATDPFFGRAGRLLAAQQRQKALKLELTVPIEGDEPRAIASGNYHEDHFGLGFGLRLASGEVAQSACFAFGLERVALALLAEHGLDIGQWPTSVRELLGLGDSRVVGDGAADGRQP